MDAKTIVPFSLKDTPALIEKAIPVQKLSIESHKEQEGRQSKSLTTLGSYWKGRKPLILNKACILGALMPATDNLTKDIEIFERLMGMDDESLVVRIGRIKPDDIVRRVQLDNLYKYFNVEPDLLLPPNTPIEPLDYLDSEVQRIRITWKASVPEKERRMIEAKALPLVSYRELVADSVRAENAPSVHDHIWADVNNHIGTDAYTFPELVEQLGVMRFGRRPRVADTFCGSGQIPFEAARLGCDVYASDLNPIACMLTWGAINIVGAPESELEMIEKEHLALVKKVQTAIDALGIENNGQGWKAKAFLYCLEVTCPQTGWSVPLLPDLLVSKGARAVARLVPDPINKRYDIIIASNVSDEELKQASKGTVRVDGNSSYLVHVVDGQEYRIRLSTIRGDYMDENGSSRNKLRLWEKGDITFRETDIYRERLYGILWQKRPESSSARATYKFCSVTREDLIREEKVIAHVKANIDAWQNQGIVPDMRIESGKNTDQIIWEKGWTHWHHLFTPRQLLTFALLNQYSGPKEKFAIAQLMNSNCRLSRWNARSGVGQTASAFDNQALNTLLNYGTRGFEFAKSFLLPKYKNFPINSTIRVVIESRAAQTMEEKCDIFITDPPYGDAVRYEEIFEFFIAWFRKKPPKEWEQWTWDSRRGLAIKGEDEHFRQGMVASYKRMGELMPAKGIQVVMFTHQSGSIWADMANIVWASRMQVTAAWYVVTETDSPLREGSYIKGTVLLVLRKREGITKTSRSDLAWDIKEEVEQQVEILTGLNNSTIGRKREENLFNDADIQMAGYAAALRVLTRYTFIDGKEMVIEAMRPRIRGQKTFVDELIEYAVGVANQALVPFGVEKEHWDKLDSASRFYLKMIELEARGENRLDSYQNFAKAFKVKEYKALMASERANAARLKSALELGRADMTGDSELAGTVLRGVLYALFELQKECDGDEVLTHLSYNVSDYFNQRKLIVELSSYLADKLTILRKEEASAARILTTLVNYQRLG